MNYAGDCDKIDGRGEDKNLVYFIINYLDGFDTNAEIDKEDLIS